MTAAPIFTTYDEAQEWVAQGQAKFGKKAFTARPEYHAAYAQIAALHKATYPDYKRPNRRTATRTDGSVNLLNWSMANA